MKIKLSIIFCGIFVALNVIAQTPNKLIVNADQGQYTISKHIYGQFSEHLGHCIYGGIWVGEDSPIPNTRGIRNDVVQALRKINIPNLRWPGGCFADEYHWEHGIGPREKRPKMINTHWGGVIEDNSFGTHEFMDLCRQLGTEPYICGNVGSGTVEEMSKWVEYLNFEGVSPMADLRKANGHPEPFGVKYWGVGNENWGCGGNMTPEFYADQYRRFATYCRDYGQNKLYKVAGGANSFDYNWTEVLMKNIPHNLMDGISLHYYTVPKNWSDKGSATQFNEAEYFVTLQKNLATDELITKHTVIMDKYDPNKKIGLIFDEWGTWYNVEPGTNPGFLFQQNTLRDAIVAGSSLNIFNNHADRVKMANIAQVINVLQSLIFTDGDKMMVTPTYHVFDLYQVHHEATLLPIHLQTADYELDGKKLPVVNASASRDANGAVHITLVNIHPTKAQTVSCELRGANGLKVTDGKIVTAPQINAHNTFEKPNQVSIQAFKGAKLSGGTLTLDLPAGSVVMVEMK